jgi:hypothetical protein
MLTSCPPAQLGDAKAGFEAYVMEYHQSLRGSEAEHQPRPDCLSRVQRDVTPMMRAILIDWLFEVAQEYRYGRSLFPVWRAMPPVSKSHLSVSRSRSHRLMPSTLHLCISLIDRSLSTFVVQNKR